MPDIIICRPNHDAKQLAIIFQKNNISAIDIPTIKIEYLNFQINQRYTDLIFTSKYAVKSFFINHKINDNAKVWAVGKSTANELKKYNIKAFYPKNKYNSEHLYNLIAKKIDFSKSKLLIIKGEKGNNYLNEKIKQSTNIYTYKRIKITKNIFIEKYNNFFVNKVPKIVIVTSLDVFKYFVENISNENSFNLIKKHSYITITSKIMLDYANKLGFKNTIFLDKINNENIYPICKNILRNKDDRKFK